MTPPITKLLLPRLHRGLSRLVSRGLLATLVLSCSGRTTSLGGESNWLALCDSDADCDDADACRCGVCTSSCAVVSDCAAYARATCAAGEAAETQCATSTTSAALCLPSCSEARPCPADQSCVNGACTLTLETTQNGSGGTEPGTGGAGTNGPGTGGSSTGGAGASQPGLAVNPSGDCDPQGDGGRSEHAPDPTDQYLPDCQLSGLGREREYYRVFVKSNGTAYTFPRLDGHVGFASLCAPETTADGQAADQTLRAVVERYGLCATAGSEAEVGTVNAMAPADALLLTRYLHDKLVFFPVDVGVSPYPFNDDILEGCKTDSEFAEQLAERCEYEITNEGMDRPDISWAFSTEEALAVSLEMNELYGVSASEGAQCGLLAGSIDDTRRAEANAFTSCRVDADCTLVGDTTCARLCGFMAVALEGEQTLREVTSKTGDRQCALWDALECMGPTADCIDPVAVCNEGSCEVVRRDP